MKRIVLGVVAVLLLAGVGGGFYWYNINTQVQTETSQWLSRSLDRVESVHVQIPEGAFVLYANDDVWEADIPGASWNFKAHAKSNKVKDYISDLADLAPQRYIGDVEKGGLDKYGLEEPNLKVLLGFSGKSGEPLTIKITSDASGRVFGWNSENPNLVYEFDDKVLERLSLPSMHFLDDYIFKFDEVLVDRVQLVQAFGSSWLVEKGESGFLFKLPGYLKDKEASDSDLKLYIHALALLKAGKLVLEPVVPEKQVAALTIRVWNKGGKLPHVVEFFTIENNPDAYLGKSSWLTVPFLLDAQSVAQLVRSAFDIQSRTVMALDIGTVDRFVIEHGSKSYTVMRSDNGWRMPGTENDIPGIDMSLWRITELKFEALPLNKLSETAIKVMHCRLLDVEGELLKAMTFYADPRLPQGQCWMKSEDGMYYPVSSRLLKDLQGMFPIGTGGSIKQ